MLRTGLIRTAGREGYIAQYNAARAYLVLRAGKIFKNHGVTHEEFRRLAGADPRLGPRLGALPGARYSLKAASDYFGDVKANKDTAAQALDEAAELIEAIDAIVRTDV